jgi:hypothetical protein
MNAPDREAIVERVAVAVVKMLASGVEGEIVPVPELGETWTISREPA